MSVETPTGKPLELSDLLVTMVQREASDLHLGVGFAPSVRVDGTLSALEGYGSLNQEAMENLLHPHLLPEQNEALKTTRELDFSYSVPGVSRFRGNILWQRGTLGAVFRAIPTQPLSIDELGMPPIIKMLAARPRGLVLVTGPTGSGKSTTLAAMIDYINTKFSHHVVTIEDPIEFLHRNKKCIIRQRELGSDTMTFAAALKHVLRQDPDVILVGEMRDLETIALAVTAAETGHLVLGTLHTTSATSTVDRIIDVFPAAQQQQIRMQLSATLQGVVAQVLVPRIGGRGRECAMEVMVGTGAVRNMIREGKTHLLNNLLASGSNVGMQTLNQALKALVEKGLIGLPEALEKSNDAGELQSLIQTRF